MHKDLSEFERQCELLALGVVLETARSDDRWRDLSEQAARLSLLASELVDNAGLSATKDDARATIDRCIDVARQRQRALAKLADDIDASAGAAVEALQFVDEDSRLVVYSRDRASRLRGMAENVEHGRRTLHRRIAQDCEALESAAASAKNKITPQHG